MNGAWHMPTSAERCEAMCLGPVYRTGHGVPSFEGRHAELMRCCRRADGRGLVGGHRVCSVHRATMGRGLRAVRFVA